MDWPLPIRVLLLPLSWIYGLVVRSKALLYTTGIIPPKRLKGQVISVGNLTVGGTGKTPMVLWLAEQFLADGKRVAILSRGYRGSHGTSDEIELLKKRLGDRVRFGVGADRFAAGQMIEQERPVDIFLLDDGYQHLALARDVNILLIDSSRPLRREFLLPAGRLREPMSAMSRADLAVFTRMQGTPSVVSAMPNFPSLPIFPAGTRLSGLRRVGTATKALPVSDLPQPVVAFCGIGNPGAFFSDLDRWGVAVAAKASFPDHHSYTSDDARRLGELARTSNAKAFVTTEKDVQNLGQARFSLPVYCCEIAMDVSDEPQFWKLIQRSVDAKAGAPL
jgi:tetraacyldisaccharide 4'-kinase